MNLILLLFSGVHSWWFYLSTRVKTNENVQPASVLCFHGSEDRGPSFLGYGGSFLDSVFFAQGTEKVGSNSCHLLKAELQSQTKASLRILTARPEALRRETKAPRGHTQVDESPQCGLSPASVTAASRKEWGRPKVPAYQLMFQGKAVLWTLFTDSDMG